MKYTKAVLMTMGGIALGLLAGPKASHAVTAALVQVMNTAAAPAIAQDVSKLASEQITLAYVSGGFLTYATPGAYVNLYRVLPNGSYATTPFQVPAGQALVVTTVTLRTETAANAYVDCQLFPGQNTIRLMNWGVPDDGYSHDYHYPNGIVIPSGSTPQFVTSTISGDSVGVYVFGYLTSN